jgi:CHAD domain-containing protein
MPRSSSSATMPSVPVSPPEPLVPDQGHKEFAARIVLQRLANLKQEIPSVQQGRDIEAVHRMRVASRRLRTALRLFEELWPPRQGKAWQRQVRRVTRSLGEARDADVQILFVAGELRSCREAGLRRGLARLLLRLRQRRADLQARVVKRVSRLVEGGVMDEMEQDLAPLAGDLGKPPAPSRTLGARAESLIQARLEALLAYEPFVKRPDCAVELHRMRIAAKRLRYALEVFDPLSNGRLTRTIAALKHIQDSLGLIHDCDVWKEFLPRFLAKEERRARDYFGNDRPYRRLLPGLTWFGRRVGVLRKRTHKEFAEFWGSTRRGMLWLNLRHAARALARQQATVKLPRAPAPPAEGQVVA